MHNLQNMQLIYKEGLLLQCNLVLKTLLLTLDVIKYLEVGASQTHPMEGNSRKLPEVKR